MRELRIVLVRHGKLAWDSRTPIPGYALTEWNQGRDAAPIDPSHRPPAELQQIARESRAVATSHLRRTIESAALLELSVTPEPDAQFREIELPRGIASRLRLRPTWWSALVRAGWWCGRSPGAESRVEASRRAVRAAAALALLAEREGRVLLVGHGQMNGFIGRQLRRTGWRGPWLRPRKFWAFTEYRREGA